MSKWDQHCTYINSNKGLPFVRVCFQVTALVVKPEEATSSVTNTFRFRFAVDNTVKPLKSILPHTKDEAEEMYLAASQHFAE